MRHLTRFRHHIASQEHLATLRRNIRRDDGYTTETIVVTALLALLAIGALSVITAKVLGRANGIDLG
ncbi:hypothetical protein [Streptomyces sp. B15]|uniref:hypothetical protein n=1 Tax=Streptomyces sp. B15 TaxID=1537797 RepID=UPI001B378259|nr:hypothetical protein [Streptomyces sp. B15]MBQ1121873.1 hypothetical protein [Streptomyces sp. B15]